MSLSTGKVTEHEMKKISGFKEDLEHLRQVSLFRGLDYECLKLLTMFCQRVEFIGDDQLMVQGEDDGHAFFILSGQVKAIFTENDVDSVIRQYGTGEFVGGCALLGRMPRIFTLQATEKTTALRLGREQFQKVLQQFPASISKITGSLLLELLEWDRSRLDMKNGESGPDHHALGISLL
jgi:CRP-like cAMP-binding protein